MTDKDILEQYQNNRQRVECWTRVMGYFRPISYFNIGKQSEFANRKWFKEEKTTNTFLKVTHMCQTNFP